MKVTKLPILINTGYVNDSGDDLREARQQIEKVAHYIESLFNLIKNSQSICVESNSDEKIQQFLEDAETVSEIGIALALSIHDSVMPILRVEGCIDFNNQVVNDVSEPVPATDCLAGSLSIILNDPDLPDPVYNAIKRALGDLANENSDALEKLESSPEYLKKLFSDLK